MLLPILTSCYEICYEIQISTHIRNPDRIALTTRILYECIYIYQSNHEKSVIEHMLEMYYTLISKYYHDIMKVYTQAKQNWDNKRMILENERMEWKIQCEKEESERMEKLKKEQKERGNTMSFCCDCIPPHPYSSLCITSLSCLSLLGIHR